MKTGWVCYTHKKQGIDGMCPACRDAEIERLRNPIRALVAFQRDYEKNTMGCKMPGNEYYSELLMTIVECAKSALTDRNK